MMSVLVRPDGWNAFVESLLVGDDAGEADQVGAEQATYDALATMMEATAAATAQRGAVQKRGEARRILASMGLPSPRGATSAVEQEAIRAVGAAEQAVAEARSSGDARAIAEAEERLRATQAQLRSVHAGGSTPSAARSSGGDGAGVGVRPAGLAPLALEAQSPGSTSGLGLSPQEDRVSESLNATAATTSTLSTEQREQLSVAQSKARAKIDALERKVAAAEVVGDAAAVEEAKAAMSAAVAVQEREMRMLAAQIDMANSTPGMHGVLPWRTLQGARLQPAVGKCF